MSEAVEETMAEETPEPGHHSRSHRNPQPRPALRFEGEEHWVMVARPLPGTPGPADAEDAAAPGKAADGDKSDGDRRKSKGEKGKKSGKGRRKAEKKRSKEDSDAAALGPRSGNGRSLTITLPEEFRKALDRAGTEHGLTAEGLAAFILVEWLDR